MNFRLEVRRSWLYSLLVAIALSVTATPVIGQILYGSVVGTVKDGQGGTVPGATVTMVAKETNLTKETTTDVDGAFTINNLPPGPYDVKVTLQGFRESVRKDVPVLIGQISRVTVSLEVGSVSETITVVSNTQLLQTDKADVSTELKSQELTSLPLNRFRNYQALLNLVPGTVPVRFNNAETDTPGRSLGTNVNGQSEFNNSTRTDGATNMNIWLPTHTMYVSPAESIDTVNVSTSSFDAEQGTAAGAQITVVTKSGTNRFKGSGFEFFNGDRLNATPKYFSAGDVPKKLPLKSNTYGGTIGGPISHDKLFFFGSYEAFKRSQSVFTLFNVPDARLRAGDFSQALNTNGSLQQIFNPATGANNGTGRDLFENNQIPGNLIDPTALKIMQLYPLPNVPGIGGGGLTSNYRRQEDRTFDRDQYDAKINYNRTPAHQIWGKVAYQNAVVDDLTNYLGPDPKASGDGGFTKVYQFTGSQTWTLKPTLLMDMTFGVSRQKQDVLGPDFQAGNYGLDVLKIPGTNNQGNSAISYPERYAGYPVFNTGFSSVGNRDGWNPIFRDERTYSLASNITKVKGHHDIRGGYSLQFLYLDHWQPETDNPRGRFEFGGDTTALRGGAQTSNRYNQFAAFLLGLPSSVNKSVQNELMTAREWQHSVFVRDRWTPSRQWTFDLGLRWEAYPMMTRADGRGIDRIDLSNPNALNVLIAGRGNNSKTNGLKGDLNNFAPRLGVVYRINDLTVARAGYGRTFSAQPWARPMRGDNDYPVTISSSFFNVEGFQPYGRLSQGIPLLVPPDISQGTVPLALAAGFWTPEPDNLDRGHVDTWNIAFERRLPFDASVDVAYVGAKGRDGYAGIDINAPRTLGGGNASRPYAPIGRTRDLISWGSRLRTEYKSLQVGLNKPFTHGLLFKGAYTLSKAMNENDNDGRVTLNWNTPSETYRNWAPAGFNRKHNFQLGFAYALPWQSQGSYSNFAKAIVQDWQINGIVAAFSGTPFTVTASGSDLNTPGNTQPANLVGTFAVKGDIGAAGTWFDTAAFGQPTGIRFGTSGRNQFVGPGGATLDFSVFRSFPLGAARRLEARVEAGNVLNHPVYGTPDGGFTSSTFGRINGINGSYPERQIRLGLRFTF